MRKFIAYICLAGAIGAIYALYKAITSGSTIVIVGGIGGSLTLVLASIAIYTLIEIRDELRDLNSRMRK